MSDNNDDDRAEDTNNNPQQPSQKEEDDEVGYGKPPKKHRFPKGVSGNPGGRKKGSRGLKTDLNAELKSRVNITENGKTITLTMQRTIIKALAMKAAKGDVKAANSIVAMTIQMNGIEDERVGKSQVSAADLAVLADFMASISGSSGPPADWPTEAVKSSDEVGAGEPSPPSSDDAAIPEPDDDVSDDDDVDNEFDVENYDEEDYDDD